METLKTSQIACSNYHYIKYSLPYFLDSMVRLDQRLIEFYAASPHLSMGDATYSSVSKLKRELDACAVAMAEEDIREDLVLLGSDMVHLDFADGTPLGHLIPGEGNLPLLDYLNALDEYEYTGAIPFEIYNRLYDFEPEKTMKKCLDYITQAIGG